MAIIDLNSLNVLLTELNDVLLSHMVEGTPPPLSMDTNGTDLVILLWGATLYNSDDEEDENLPLERKLELNEIKNMRSYLEHKIEVTLGSISDLYHAIYDSKP